MRPRFLLSLLLIGCAFAAPCVSMADPAPKKVTTHVQTTKPKKAKKKSKKAPKPKKGKPGSYPEPGLIRMHRVNNKNDEMLCNALCQICFSGYDKRPSAKQETIFVTNSMPNYLKRVTVHLTYIDPHGRKLHERDVVLECDVPPGETRNVTFTAWDKQGRFYYCGGPVPRTGGAVPYDITLEPVEYQFRP